MREIKFRAWNDEDKVMIDADHLAFEEYLPLKDQLASCTHLMQFTGLKDKNGVDIYEGDIIKIDRYSEPLGEIEQCEGGQYYINHKEISLKYKHQIHCEVCETDTPVFFLDFFVAYEIEIIGNIHQNKELLTR